MAKTVPGSDIELGKWYLPTQAPPSLPDEIDEDYSLLLAIKNVGIYHGFYIPEENQFYWHCERYRATEDYHIAGFNRTLEINSCLEWVYEKARGVMMWMMIQSCPDMPSLDGLDGYAPNPDIKDSDWEDETEPDEQDLGFALLKLN